MRKKACAICAKEVDRDDLPLLTIGAGVPRLLCPECAELIDTATLGRDFDEIKDAMDTVMAKMAESNTDDRYTVETVTEMFKSAAERAAAIKDGSWDFADDERDDDSFDEIPEELLESEEDRRLDEREEKTGKKIDKILTWVMAGILTLAAAFMVWFLFFR